MASLDRGLHCAQMSSMTVMKSPAADRNKHAILQVLQQLVPTSQPLVALEIASGTGQHVSYLADHLPTITWQPSECDEKSMQSIHGYLQITQHRNILEPVWIDTTKPLSEWANGSIAEGSCDLIMCINMIHIAHRDALEGLFQGSGYYLRAEGLLAVYGPFSFYGKTTPESNVQFDRMLRQQNSDWGLRDVSDLEDLAKGNGMVLEKTVEMPANNHILVFRKLS